MNRNLKYLRNCWKAARKHDAVLFIVIPAALAAYSGTTGHADEIIPFILAATIGFRWFLDQPEVRLAQMITEYTGKYATVWIERNDPENPDRITVLGDNVTKGQS